MSVAAMRMRQAAGGTLVHNAGSGGGGSTGQWGYRNTPGILANYPIPAGTQVAVSGGGGNLQSALTNGANSGKILVVANGSYTVGNIGVVGSVTVIGNGSGVIVDGGNAANGPGGSASGVKFANIKFQNYNSGDGQQASIAPNTGDSGTPGSSPSQAWTFDQCEFTGFGNAVVRCPSDGIISNCYFHGNGSINITGFRTNHGQVYDNYFFDTCPNGTYGWKGSTAFLGAMKPFDTTNWQVHHNTVDMVISGCGIWFDDQNSGANIYSNLVTRTCGPGILWEISFWCQIHDNKVQNCGKAQNNGTHSSPSSEIPTGGHEGTGILISCSPGNHIGGTTPYIDVYSNTCISNGGAGVAVLCDGNGVNTVRQDAGDYSNATHFHGNDVTLNPGDSFGECMGVYNFGGSASPGANPSPDGNRDITFANDLAKSTMTMRRGQAGNVSAATWKSAIEPTIVLS